MPKPQRLHQECRKRRQKPVPPNKMIPPSTNNLSIWCSERPPISCSLPFFGPPACCRRFHNYHSFHIAAAAFSARTIFSPALRFSSGYDTHPFTGSILHRERSGLATSRLPFRPIFRIVCTFDLRPLHRTRTFQQEYPAFLKRHE